MTHNPETLATIEIVHDKVCRQPRYEETQTGIEMVNTIIPGLSVLSIGREVRTSRSRSVRVAPDIDLTSAGADITMILTDKQILANIPSSPLQKQEKAAGFFSGRFRGKGIILLDNTNPFLANTSAHEMTHAFVIKNGHRPHCTDNCCIMYPDEQALIGYEAPRPSRLLAGILNSGTKKPWQGTPVRTAFCNDCTTDLKSAAQQLRLASAKI